jgi:hypothetical protein
MYIYVDYNRFWLARAYSLVCSGIREGRHTDHARSRERERGETPAHYSAASRAASLPHVRCSRL